jgi:integrase/recombinase XerD
MDKANSFESWLQVKGYRDSTITGHLKNLSYFMNWVEQAGYYEVENVSYNDLLLYVQYEQGRGLDTSTINLRLSSVTKYFDYLHAGYEVTLPNVHTGNPARSLRVRGKLQTVTRQPLRYEELEALYEGYKNLQREVPERVRPQVEQAHSRNVVVLGLMIWQGLHSGELDRLQVQDIRLSDGKIIVPATGRSNTRELRLEAKQILILHSYLYGGLRDKLKPVNEKLFPGRAADTVQHLLEELKGINAQVRNAGHIRASVLLHWLRQYNKRQVQYMAGHKYIDSTEKYVVQELDGLAKGLMHHHPFG